jgi:hypothetical protein
MLKVVERRICASYYNQIKLIYVAKPKGKKPLGLRGHRWNYNVEVDLEIKIGRRKVARYSDRWRAVVNTALKYLLP